MTDWFTVPNPRRDTSLVRFYLARDTGDSDFGAASGGEVRDSMTPDPPCP